MEPNYRWATRIADLDSELLWVDAAFADAVVGIAAAHDLHATTHVVALKLFVGEDAPVVTELVRVVRGKMFRAKFIVGHCKLRGCKLPDVTDGRLVPELHRDGEDIPFVLVRTPNVSSAPTGIYQFPLAVVDADCIPGMV